MTDPDGGQLQLQVEVKPVGTPFNGTGLITGSSVPSGSVASAFVGGLTRTKGYHWRARALDGFGAASQNWVSFGANAETDRDFVVEAPIVFASGNGLALDIWIMNPDGSGLTRLTTNTGFDGDPEFSPDGSKITYMSSPTTGGSNRDIWVMGVDGSTKTQLTTNPGIDQNPTWSGDGTRIAFSSIRTAFSNTPDIWSMNADGTDPRRLTTVNGPDIIPAWSRDGSRIAFVSVRDGNEELFVMNFDGSGQTQLTFTGGSIRNTTPTWSPDGLNLAFASTRVSNNFEIYSLVVASPTTVTRLTIRTQKQDVAPSWSRDGRRIVFASGNPNGTGYDIWRMLSNGSSQVRLTTTTPNDNAPNW